MSAYDKHRSYRKMENSSIFPNDFFSTLNISNLKKGPRVSTSIRRQIKKSDKSLSRICKRERSLDITDSYLINTPDISNNEIRVRFPKISGMDTLVDQKERANRSAFLENDSDRESPNYKVDFSNRYDLGKRRLHRYLKSEDRLRKNRYNLVNIKNNFNLNLKGNKGLANSPNPSQKMLNSSKKLFSIHPFNLETSTQATTSHSMRKRAKEATGEDSPTEDFKLEMESVRQLEESPKIKPSLKLNKSKIALGPLKIKVKCKTTSLNKIKLKFKRHNDHLNMFNSSKMVGYCTQPMETEELRGIEVDDEGFLSQNSDNNYQSTPRKTAYFGK